MRRPTKLLLLSAAFATSPAALSAGESGGVQRGAEVIGDPVVGVTIEVDLRDLPLAPAWRPGDPIKEIPRRKTRPESGVVGPTDGRDPLLDAQLAADFGLDTTEVLNIAGQGFSGVNPPDTVGDAGPLYYIQAINAGAGTPFVVHDKTDGSIVAGPIFMHSLGLAGNCSDGLGDPIVLYDEEADRWLLSEFASSGNQLCVYVSKGPDPVTDGWCGYAFQAPGFPDYPKYGVWTDAYYVTTNESSPAVYAFDRVNMIAPLPTSDCPTARPLQRFTAPDLAGFPFQALTPADIDGEDLPAPGAPGIIMRHRDNEVHNPPGSPGDIVEVWEFDVNWDTPASSTFTLTDSVAVAEFDSDLCGLVSFSCFPQPGSGTTLDPLREVIMNRLAWRGTGGGGTLIGNFVTDVDGTNRGGERWFELRDDGTGWALEQEGTYSPDAVNRWMGGIAMDGDGNILLGYNVSSGAVHPGLRYTGRESSDPPGTMSATETTLIAGSAANGSNRYGDYSSMSIDPVDDCTFWFTGMYNVSSQWSTRIGAVKFDACGDPGFSLGVNPGARTICAGETAEFALTLGSIQEFDEPVTLSALGNPAPSTVDFTVNPVPALPGASTMTIDDTTGVGFGTSLITISGLSAPSAVAKSKDVSLTVYPASPLAPVLSSPPDNAVDLPRSPNLQWALSAQTVDYFVEVATDAAFTNVVRSATVTAASWIVAPPLDTSTEYFWRVAAANPCGDSPASAVFSFTTADVPPTLLVDDDDNSPSVLPMMTALLNTANLAHDVWTAGPNDTNEPTAADLAPYKRVIWFSGDAFGTAGAGPAGPGAAAETALAAWLDLDTGNCLVLNSQDYLWDNNITSFGTNYLGLATENDDEANTTATGRNFFSSIGAQALVYGGLYTNYNDVVTTLPGTHTAFDGSGGTSSGAGAIYKDAVTWKTALFTIAFEAFPVASRQAVFDRTMQYCDAVFQDGLETNNTNRWADTEP